VLKEERDLELWFNMALTAQESRSEIRDILRNEISAQKDVTGLEPFFSEESQDVINFHHYSWITIAAKK